MKRPGREVDPVREGVQARERHVARADLQRHEVVPEAGEHRRDEEKIIVTPCIENSWS